MFWNSKPDAQKVNKSLNQILELEAEKKSLQMEKEQINLELANIKARKEMELEKIQHKHQLALDTEKAVFEQEKTIWMREKQELLENAEKSRREFEESLNRKVELDKLEVTTMLKLQSQQETKQLQLDNERVLGEMMSKHCKEVSELRASLSEEYYNKLTEAFQEIQMKGDKNSKFLQELTLKMFDKAPSSKFDVGVNVNRDQKLLEE